MAELNSSPKNHRIVYDKEQDSLQTLDTSKFKKTGDPMQELLREAEKNASAPQLLNKAPAIGSTAKPSLEQIGGLHEYVDIVEAQKKASGPEKKKAETARPKLHLEPDVPVQTRPANPPAKQLAASARRISKDQTPPLAMQKSVKPKK